MKVEDLFEVKRVPSDKGYYTPGYDDKAKIVRGTVEDWLARLDASSDDVAAAVQQARSLPSFKALEQYEETTAREKKNGTFSFTKPGSEEKYAVYASGQIRASSGGRPTRLASPKPRVVVGSAVKSLVAIYDGAFTELAKKINKHIAKAKS